LVVESRVLGPKMESLGGVTPQAKGDADESLVRAGIVGREAGSARSRDVDLDDSVVEVQAGLPE
jgi:hypothetical protein